jgi:hypothetical protein
VTARIEVGRCRMKASRNCTSHRDADLDHCSVMRYRVPLSWILGLCNGTERLPLSFPVSLAFKMCICRLMTIVREDIKCSLPGDAFVCVRGAEACAQAKGFAKTI